MYKAKELGYHARIIDAGRFVNDSMGGYGQADGEEDHRRRHQPGRCPGVDHGRHLQENVTDIRNSKVADVVKELQSFSCHVDVVDPHADHDEVKHEYGYELASEVAGPYDAVIVAVNHDEYAAKDEAWYKGMLKPKGVLVTWKDLPGKMKELSY